MSRIEGSRIGVRVGVSVACPARLIPEPYMKSKQVGALLPQNRAQQ